MTTQLELFEENIDVAEDAERIFNAERRPLAHIYNSDEIRADILGKLWYVAGKYDPFRNIPFKNFALMAVLRCLRNNLGLKTNRKRKEVSLTDCDEEMRELQIAGSELEGYWELEEFEKRRRTVSHVLCKLKPRDNRVLTMRFYEGMTYNQIGNELGVSLARAHKLSERAMDHTGRLYRQMAEL